MVSYRSLGGHAGKCHLSPEELFWFKVAKADGCWLWIGRLDKLGYGRFGRKGPLVFAHRVAWTFTNGPIPAGMDVCHTCDVRSCCNPAHMFLGTHDDNMADCMAKGRNVRGARSVHAKLTDADVLTIRARYKRTVSKGHTVRSNVLALAAEYGVTRGTIQQAALGRRWKHLPMPDTLSGDEGSA